jgi:hypothetical protein
MTMQELDWYCDGSRVRDASIKFGLRRIWATLYNANVAKKSDMIKANQLIEYWPLYTDKILTEAEIAAEEDELREGYHLLSKIIRERDASTDSAVRD